MAHVGVAGNNIWLRIINMPSPEHACRSTSIYAAESCDDLHKAYVPRVIISPTVPCEPRNAETTCLCATQRKVANCLGYSFVVKSGRCVADHHPATSFMQVFLGLIPEGAFLVDLDSNYTEDWAGRSMIVPAMMVRSTSRQSEAVSCPTQLEVNRSASSYEYR